MPTIRRPGSMPSDPQTVPAPPESTAPAEHSLSHLEVPTDTTPTWELEMLVSGAVLVGLFQLPPVLADALAWVSPRMGTELTRMLAGMVILLVRGAVYVLIIAFVTHLGSRAYWVALVGLDSVFPRGIRWERPTGLGPVTQEIARERVPTLPALISRLDNFCSVVFAVGFASALFSVSSLLLFTLVVSLVWLGSAVLPGRSGFGPAGVLLWAFALSMILFRVLDRRFGARVAADSLPGRLLRVAARVVYNLTGMRLMGPIVLTLRTNLQFRAVTFALLGLFFAGVGLSMTQMFVSRGELTPGQFAGLPDAARSAARDYLFYADQRLGEDARRSVPFIQSDVVRDPYVRLFIPYDPIRDDRAAAGCVRPAQGQPADTQAARALRCVATIHAISVNGRPRPDLDFRFYTDPVSGLSGVLTYIPVADLPKGRNVVSVAGAAVPDAAAGARPLAPVTIAFWL